MKIQKNKKHNEIKAGRKAIADLLRNGKEEVARVKVEGVIRDEMLLEAFEILDLFVELLLSRLEMMKMQSGCPFDLREAVCTVIYAAPRMSVKELSEVRSMFIQKYGKPFASEAMENKGSCVNSKVIHKMSVVTPETCQVFDCLGSIAKVYVVSELWWLE
jgi:vacuolar protein sorting-associated protein IST1